MKLLSALFASIAALTLSNCGRTPPAAGPAAAPITQPPVPDVQLTEWRDALARQAVEFEARSALLDRQLAEMEQKLRQQENDALRGQLDSLRQQNETLRSQADAARRQSDTITQRLAMSTPPSATPQAASRDFSIFYERLAPHGRWLEVTGHGLCFQPRVARTQTWRPYVDGCWAWTTLGWAWRSNESFGWATYHYGRWLQLVDHGWIWVPGGEWAPAWVAWRQSRDHIGWAPLPPERGLCTEVRRDCDSRYGLGPSSYTFIRTSQFVCPTYTTLHHPVSYNTAIFSQTVNITRIVPCGGGAGHHLYMHHGGPPRHQVEQACRQPVPQSQIKPADPATLPLRPVLASHQPAGSATIGIIELPPAAATLKLPDVVIAERITSPTPANPLANLAPEAHARVMQVLEEDSQPEGASTSPAVAAGPAAEPTGFSTPISLSQPSSETLTAVPAVTFPASLPARPEQAVKMVQPLAVESLGTSETSPQTAGTTVPDPLPSPESPARTPLSPLGTPPVPETSALLTGAPEISPLGTSPEATRTPMVTPHALLPDGAASPVDPAAAPASAPLVPVAETSLQMTPPVLEPATTVAAATEPVVTAAAPEQSAPVTTPQETIPQQQLEAAALQQRLAAEAEARAAVESQEAARQQAEAAAMQQRQAEETARAAAAQEEQMRQAAEAEAARRAQEEARERILQEERMRQAEMQRQAEEAARQAAQQEAQRQAEAMQRAQEEAQRRAAEEQMRLAQEEARRQAEEAARRAQEEAMQRAQEEAQRRAQEEAMRQAAEATRRAEDEARRAAEEAARRAAEEAAARPAPAT